MSRPSSIERAALTAIQQQDRKRTVTASISRPLQDEVTNDAGKLFGAATSKPDSAYFTYHTEVEAAQNAVRELVGELLALNPYLIHSIEAVIQNRQQALQGEL